ncbi:hypothetical protein CERZMDRAFT_113032 [Cercospora zeae-maydis SCOH1-5]|uniref:Apple domain-containing protein n=1 Tax=Cercospora zeae-maydis SCOH1-5 TaxID=717836 RepID=A0A6A6FC44_9PEZI|nr:hypothetical protein CERZMDRAFT_113032 [Cercospora zeae-maydis SCOH1-5]
MDSSHREPGRLSALYQYHNAPEVAPAHGLEYDDTIYPSSDKYPVLRESPLYDAKFSGNGRYFGDGSNRPPRIIFGMKIRTFLVVATVMVLVVVGAAVGGAVGGKQLREQHATQLNANLTNTPLSAAATATATTASGTATSAFAAPTPTFQPLNDCPASSNTRYTSELARGESTSESTGLVFVKNCDLENPVSAHHGKQIAQAFVYSFSDCIEICAGYNKLNSAANCTVAAYEPSAPRPANCWLGDAGDVDISTLNTTKGTNVATLQ